MHNATQKCGTCRWAKFREWTKHKPPRPVKNGTCEWPAPSLTLPVSITRSHGYRPLGNNRNAIWPDMGADCPVWEQETP